MYSFRIFSRTRPFVLLVSFLIFNSTHAETQPELWSLPRVLARASESSPQLKVAESEIIVAKGQAHQAGRWENPELSLSAGPMKYSTFNGQAYAASVTQEIPFFGQKSTAAAVLKQGEILAEKNLGVNQLKLKHTVIQLSYDLFAARIQYQHIAHRKENILLIGQYLATRPFASPSGAVEKNLIQNRIREIEDKFLASNSDRKKRWQDLNVYLNLDQEVIPNLAWLKPNQALNVDELKSSILRMHPEIQRQEVLVKQADLSMDQANTKSYPDIRVGANYSYQTVDQPQTIYNGVLSLTLPIWNAGGGAQKAANAQKIVEESRLEIIRRQALSEFEIAWSEFEESENRMKLYPLTLVNSLENEMKKAEANWRKGLLPVTSFLELETQVHDQINRVYESQVLYVKDFSKLLQLAGRNFPIGEQ